MAQGCKSDKFVGRDCMLQIAIGCGDKVPAENEWKRLAAMRTKSMTLTWDTIDATADDSKGAVKENLAGYQEFSVSGDGVCKVGGEGAETLISLTKHVANPSTTGGQPVAWVRLTYPDITLEAFCIITNCSREAPYDDVVTYSFEASLTASDHGLVIKDTPKPAPTPTPNPPTPKDDDKKPAA